MWQLGPSTPQTVVTLSTVLELEDNLEINCCHATILLMEKPKPRQVRQLVQGHTAC